jgi:hypothetical protein
VPASDHDRSNAEGRNASQTRSGEGGRYLDIPRNRALLGSSQLQEPREPSNVAKSRTAANPNCHPFPCLTSGVHSTTPFVSVTLLLRVIGPLTTTPPRRRIPGGNGRSRCRPSPSPPRSAPCGSAAGFTGEPRPGRTPAAPAEAVLVVPMRRGIGRQAFDGVRQRLSRQLCRSGDSAC